jgi:hypothetical protein
VEKEMKILNRFIDIIAILFIALILSLLFYTVSNSKEPADPFIEPKLVEMTYYSYTGSTCANGKHPRYGVVAYSHEYIGYTAIIYSVSENGTIGEKIGYFEIYDTGYGRKESNGKGTIQNGNCIDVFHETDSDGKEFISKYGNKCYIQIVKGVG